MAQGRSGYCSTTITVQAHHCDVIFIFKFRVVKVVYCEEDNKCYTVGMGSLETEESDFLTEENLKKGQAGCTIKIQGKEVHLYNC